MSERSRRCSRAEDASNARTRDCHRAIRHGPCSALESARRHRRCTIPCKIIAPCLVHSKRSSLWKETSVSSAALQTERAHFTAFQRCRALCRLLRCSVATTRASDRAAVARCARSADSAAAAQCHVCSSAMAVRCAHSMLRFSTRRSQSVRCLISACLDATNPDAAVAALARAARARHVHRPILPCTRQSNIPKRRSFRC
mmetsp:Transcript_2544/g.4213  ORF Transcript_2544/g.4213 Transcript_2544/m.4213 type:complete len:200 (-) Transcript_2544:124-723(-)